MPAQLTTFGRRAATWIEELLFSFDNLENLCDRLPIKGIKGPVGTAQDLMDLFGNSSYEIEEAISKELDFTRVLTAPSQIYPRSIDYEIVTALVQLAGSPSNIATNVRIMSGFGLVSEGFEKDQVGSSAMPHKINPRLSERVNSLTAVLKGNVVMVQELVGNQWNEGDVSCSVIRRVALANSFYAIDAILDTTIRIIRDIVIHYEKIESEVSQNLPFLATTRLVSNLVENGKGREDAYAAIKKHVAASREHLRKSGTNNLFNLIQSDSSLEIGAEFLDDLRDPKNLIGYAKGQTEAVVAKAMAVIKLYSDSLTYSPSNSI